jgi:hydrogenase maturation protease
MRAARVLVAGVGNIFLSDDGFGVEVARRLAAVSLPEWVRVVDYGIRGMHLAYDLAGGEYDLTVLVDAAGRGERPGTVSVVELDPVTAPPPASVLDAHGMQPDVVLGLVAQLGARPGRVILVGCEPAVLDEGMTLSPVVAAMVDSAVRAVVGLVGEYESGNSVSSISNDVTTKGGC